MTKVTIENYKEVVNSLLKDKKPFSKVETEEEDFSFLTLEVSYEIDKNTFITLTYITNFFSNNPNFDVYNNGTFLYSTSFIVDENVEVVIDNEGSVVKCINNTISDKVIFKEYVLDLKYMEENFLLPQ